MRLIIKIIFVLAFLVLNLFLLMPIGNRGVSWEEAGLAIIPTALISFICFILLLAGVGVKDRTQFSSARWWVAGLLWGVLVGGIVTFMTYSSYEKNSRYGSIERTSSSSRRDDDSLEKTYARYDQIGMMYGFATLGFGAFAVVGLALSLVLKKKMPSTPPTT